MTDKPIYSSFGIQRVVTYKDLFPERRAYKVSKLLAGPTKSGLFRLISNIAGKLVNKPFYNTDFIPNPKDSGIDVPRFFFCALNAKYMMEVINRFHRLRKRENKTPYDMGYVSTTEESLLYIMREFMALPERTQKIDRKKFEKNFFKALMCTNDLTINRHKENNPYPDEEVELHWACEVLKQFGSVDFLYSNSDLLIVTQTIMCIAFFEFALQHTKLAPMVADFCTNHEASYWWKFPKALWSVFAITGGQTGIIDFSGLKTADQEELYNVIMQSCIPFDKIINKKDNRDYTAFRSKPLIRTEDGKCLVYCMQFVVEHIYNSLYFEFRDIAMKHYGMTMAEFKTLYSTEFSEQYLFSGNLKYICDTNYDSAMDDLDCKKADGSKDRDQVSPPDFYVRKGNVVFLFENKDVKIADNTRENGSLQDYLDVIHRDLVRDGKKPKGVGQLMRTISKIRLGEFQRRWDAGCPQDAIVYPVLVVAEYKHTTAGVKNMLQYWQRAEESVKNGITMDNIKPLIYTDAASLVLFRDNLKSKGFQYYFEDYLQKSDFEPLIKTHDLTCLANGLSAFSDYMNTQKRMNAEKFANQWAQYLKQ